MHLSDNMHSNTLDNPFIFILLTEKMQQEIDMVIGQERSPNMEDRKSLPFTYAVIHEVQRFLDIVPLSLPHYALKDISFRGYTIPKVSFHNSIKG